MIPPPSPDSEPIKPAKKAPKSIISVNVRTVILNKNCLFFDLKKTDCPNYGQSIF